MWRVVLEVQEERLRGGPEECFSLFGKQVGEVALGVNLLAILIEIVRSARIAGTRGPVKDVVRTAAEDGKPLMKTVIPRPKPGLSSQRPFADKPGMVARIAETAGQRRQS